MSVPRTGQDGVARPAVQQPTAVGLVSADASSGSRDLTGRSASRNLRAESATVVGRALGSLFFAIAKARSSSHKALHPRGELRRGLLHRQGCAWPTGVPWLDDAGHEEVLLRFSRSAGLPEPLPDVLGLAMRMSLPNGSHGDVLLNTCGGGGRWGRFLLRPARHRGAMYSSLIPYEAPTGPLLLAALPTDGDGSRFELVCARPRGRWSSFGRLNVLPAIRKGHDTATSFDPVLNVVPGLTSYTWIAEVRQLAYAASRRARVVETEGRRSR